MLEKLLALPALVIIGCHIVFLCAFLSKGSRLRWPLVLTPLGLLVYVPYEAYFHLPEVSLNVPIRVDMLLIVPIMMISLPVNAYGWLLLARKSLKELRSKPHSSRLKSVSLIAVSYLMFSLMLASSIGWFILVGYHLCWAGVQFTKELKTVL